jgi:hypothetical protein
MHALCAPMPDYHVAVTYEYRPPTDGAPARTSQAVVTVAAISEYLVLRELQQQFPEYREIVVLEARVKKA